MNTIKRRLHITMELFFKITTGITFVSMAFIACFWGMDAQLEIAPFLGQILITAALCSLVTLFADYEQEMSKKSMLLHTIGNYIYENIVVLGCGIKFQWFYLNDWKMLLGMVIAVAVVYFGVMALSMERDYKTAQKMNEKLRER